jgi:hypothetical protein
MKKYVTQIVKASSYFTKRGFSIHPPTKTVWKFVKTYDTKESLVELIGDMLDIKEEDRKDIECFNAKISFTTDSQVD